MLLHDVDAVNWQNNRENKDWLLREAAVSIHVFPDINSSGMRSGSDAPLASNSYFLMKRWWII